MRCSPALLAILLLSFLSVRGAALDAQPVSVPASIDHSGWNALLQEYVDDHGLVDYGRWKASPEDLGRLDAYLADFARTDAALETGDGGIAALINAYNAFTIRWILQNYPTDSIRELDGSWNKARWNIGGRMVSLDEIEHKNLRPLDGWRVHATIVCAARSCPPLLREAYTAENLKELTDRAWRAWLAREDLNQFDPPAGEVRLSPIFRWFKEDFTGDGEVASVLEGYAPDRNRTFLAARDYATSYLDYHWGLNDQSGRGIDYSPSLWRRLF